MSNRDEINRRFGRLLSRWRKKAGISQEALGAALGLSRTSVTNIERGRQPVQLHTLYQIADALGVDPTDLLPASPKLKTTRTAEQQQLQALSAKTSDWLSKITTVADEKETQNGRDSKKGG